MTPFIPPSIPSTIPLNTPKTIQIPSSLVDFALVSYVVLLILHGLKSLLSFTSWFSMTLVIFGLILHIFGSFINTYGTYFKYIYHSDFYTHHFSQVAHTFPSLAPYPHRDTKDLVFVVPYDNISDL